MVTLSFSSKLQNKLSKMLKKQLIKLNTTRVKLIKSEHILNIKVDYDG